MGNISLLIKSIKYLKNLQILELSCDDFEDFLMFTNLLDTLAESQIKLRELKL